MSDGTEYQTCTEPAIALDGSDPTTFATGSAVNIAHVVCRFAQFGVPDREALTAATGEICADILERLHDSHRR
ncbi:hypothetical protein [Glycomyces harbinensis]|uniref:hypothetical protein n=1 Tax=Glycomyces harbinensis TaxID=58114 RepID=UPI00115FE641|nr:hypothetical protein [Glycomyces harbinensis]